MTFTRFIGIDISKNKFDVAFNGGTSKSVKTFSNDSEGFVAFIEDHKELLPQAFFVLEATGGYETALLKVLISNNVAVHRADGLHAKHFIRSLGKRAKTDSLDALALARYGADRHQDLRLYQAIDSHQDELKALQARRDDVITMRKAELCRKKHPNYQLVHELVDDLLSVFDKQITDIEARIRIIISSSPHMAAIFKVLVKTQGVGEKTAFTMLACLPELGKITRRQAASLAGCAPHPRDSGNMAGYRHTSGGRAIVKKALFMAAMAARNFHPNLKAFYLRLIENGKKPMVALMAVMRKLIVILNAKIRDEIYLTTQ